MIVHAIDDIRRDGCVFVLVSVFVSLDNVRDIVYGINQIDLHMCCSFVLVCIHIYIYVYIEVYLYIYMYIYVERESARDKGYWYTRLPENAVEPVCSTSSQVWIWFFK